MPTKSVLFIDSRVSNYQSFIDGLTEPTEVFVLDGASDGLAQMATYLYGRTGIDAIHVISHGSVGTLYLGSTVLDGGNLANYQSQLASIGSALTVTGDILLYGCNVAQGEVGVQLILSLAQATGADVAGSSDATGAEALGGDWVLEASVGDIGESSVQLKELSSILGVNTAPTFTVADGIVITKVSNGNDVGYSVALQSNGKILVGGHSYSGGIPGFVLVRYNSDGSLDTSFSGDGVVATEVGNAVGGDFGYGVALQSDGKILLVGTSGYSDFAIVRYNNDGSLDTGFSGDGMSETNVGSNSETGYDVVVQADGKILVAGASGSNFTLVRYNQEGSLDTSFSGDGIVTTAVGGDSSAAYSIALQPDGKILVAGYDTANKMNFALVRYNVDGSLDTSFSGDGIATTAIGSGNDLAMSVALQLNGKILVAGRSDSGGFSDFALVRYNSDGSLDSNFSSDGKLTTAVGNYYDACTSIVVQQDGKILAAGISSNGGNSQYFTLVRYNQEGSLDTSFSGDGIVTTAVGGDSSAAYSIALQPDGKILLAGGANSDFAVVRYNTDGSLDTTFSPSENTLDNVTAVYEQNTAVLASNVLILDTEHAASGDYNGATLTLTRHDAASVQDIFSAIGGNLTPLNTGSYFAFDSVTIGRVTTNSAGKVSLTFNANATQSLVNKAMQQIAYSNTSDAPPATVQIDWTFNDGNTGAQGTGGAMSVTGSTTVQITAVNDTPVLSVPLVDQTSREGSSFTYTIPAGSFTDPDLDSLSYSVKMADGTAVPPWLTFNAATRTFAGTPSAFDVGVIDIQVTAKDAAGVSVSDVFRLTVSPPDTSPPTVVTFTPLKEATGVAIDSNIAVTFSEEIVKGNGNGNGNGIISLKAIGGNTVATYDVAASSNVVIAGNTLSINPSADLSYSSGYTIEFSAGTVKDLSGNSFAGASGYNFYTSAASTSTTLNFDQTHDSVVGGIPIHFTEGGSNGVYVYGLTYRVGFSPPKSLGQLSEYSYFSTGKLITEGEYAAVADGNGKYVLIQLVDAQLVAYGDAQNGIVFNSYVEPTVTSFSPLDEQLEVAVGANIVISFNESVVRGLGSIVLKTMIGSTVATYDAATSTSLSIAGSVLTINPVADLAYNTGYKVEFAPGTIKSSAGNNYSGTTSYNFTTAAFVNSLPGGNVTITGAPTQGQTLTASNSVADADGLGSISYQWAATGVPIPGATASTLTLAEAQVGKAITVTASFIDGHGTAEAVTSTPSSSVANLNDVLTGAVTISGTATQGQTLTANNTLADSDGLGTVTYQWLANGIAIAGATSNTLTLVEAQVGKAVTVTASYTDGHGTVESSTSAATNAVANVNDAPTGAVTINGVTSLGQTLSAANTLADLDGLGTISFQWSADSTSIAGATSSTLTLTDAQTGKAITVTASYTDGHGTTESVKSSATSLVTNVPPQTITGTAGNDSSLTGGQGNDTINGLAGLDTAVYTARMAVYTISPTAINGHDGSDTLTSIERLQFLDANLAFDIDANAGQVYRLYQAAFNRTPDLSGLGGWIAAMDDGMPLLTIASKFMESAEFQSLYGANPTNAQFVANLYTNALHRPSQQDAGSAAGWVNQLSSNAVSKAQALVNFSESAENKASVLQVISGGITYATAVQAAGPAKGQSFAGTPNADSLIGTVGNDTFTSGAGNDTIEGGKGLDTAVYSGTKANHTITRTATGLTVAGVSNGTDTLTNVERLKFDDAILAMDTAGNAGQTYRLYQAAFNRTPDKAGLSDWVKGMDTGLTLTQMATAFIGSAEFKDKYGANPTNAEFVDLLYTNALHRARAVGDDYWTNQLDSGVTREQALIGFSESTENQASLIGVIQNGIELVV